MRKFTIFTVILTIVIIVVIGQILVDEYLPNLKTNVADSLAIKLPDSLNIGKDAQTNVLGADLGEVSEEANDGVAISTEETLSGAEILPNEVLPTEASGEALPVAEFTDEFSNLIPVYGEPIVAKSSVASGPLDFEDPNFAVAGSSSSGSGVYLREEQIKSAGFVGGYLEPEPHNGLLFKTIAIDDLDDTQVDKVSIRTADQILAKVYIFKVGITNDANSIYQLLKLKSSKGFDVEINETNSFGANSFYMNDSRRAGTVFLTVRIGGAVYAFSYPKDYHSQVKNLIKLLEWEVG